MVTQSIDFKRSPTLLFVRDRSQQTQAVTERLLDKIEAQNRYEEAQRLRRQQGKEAQAAEEAAAGKGEPAA